MKVLSSTLNLVIRFDNDTLTDATVHYSAQTEDNVVSGKLKLKLDAAQMAQVETWLTNNVVPQIKAWEAIV